jgi:hypothetical protein
MLMELVVTYLGGWVIATLSLYAAGRRFSTERQPGQYAAFVSVVAGAIWPLLVVGLVELSSIMVFTKVQSKPRERVGNFA